MANRRREPVTYRPFRTEPVLAEGLLAVARPGGEFLDRVADAMFGIAARAGQVAQADATRRGNIAGQAAAVAGRPQTDVTGGATTPGAASRDVSGLTRGISGDIRSTISAAAQRHGVDPNALMRVAMLESSGNPKAKNPNSSAGGLFQFIDSTAKDYGLADRYDPAQASDAAARLMKDNAAHLRRTLGREPSAGELYLAHQQGAGGAAKLLKNPGADAASIVGADAVRLNGGRAGMTAGEFASLWTRKAEGGPAPAATADEARPPEMAGAGNTVQAGGTFQPRSGNSAYDRSYNAAGVRTYVQMLETEMRDTTQQLFEQYKEDPAGLQKALEANRRDMAGRHVFPEILGDFEAGYGAMAQRYIAQARENQTTKLKEQDRAAYYERTAALETDRQKRLASFDPDNPDMADAIASSQKAIDDHYDAGVAKGIYKPEEAARAKSESRRTAALEYYAKQANALDADGVKAMRAELKEDFTGGGVAGLDGQGYAELDAGLDRLEKQKRREAADMTEAFRVRGDQMVNRIGAGFEVDPAEMSKLMLDSGRTPEGKAALDETLAKISDARAVRDMTIFEGTAFARKLRAGIGDAPTAAQLRRLASVELQLEQKRKAIAEDQLSYAESRKLVAPTPALTDAQSADDVLTIMQARMLTAPKAAAELGVTPRYLKAGEATAIGKLIRARPEEGATIAAAIVSGAGDRVAAVLAEFGDDAPLVSEAGAILALGGSPQAAQDVIAGYGKGVDGKALKSMKPAIARSSFREVAGDALALAPRDASRIERAAGAIARKRIAEDGLELDSDEAREVHARALQEAAGAVFDRGVQFGGFADVNGKVLIPSAIRADAFEDVLAAITDEDLAGLKQKPKPGVASWWSGYQRLSPVQTIQRARPAAVSGGFAFALGDPAGDDPQFVQGDDGEIFVLDLMSLRDQLSARVPGAFR